MSAGTLPAGLTLNASTGVITGTPTAVGASSFTIRATDSVGNSGTQAYSVNIGANTLAVDAGDACRMARRASPTSQTVSASGGVGAPYTYAITSARCPPA